jgi:hypothetical protein
MIDEKLIDVVKNTLLEDVRTRDNDTILIFQVMSKLDPDFRPEDRAPMTVNNHYKKIHDKELPTHSSITRARRFMNQEYPETRGKSYHRRKNAATKHKRYFVKKTIQTRQIETAKKQLNIK